MLHFFETKRDGYETWHLASILLTVAGLSTAIYGPSKPDKIKKSILLIHGIGGDRHGTTPFGYELRQAYNVYIVELPGHGATAIPSERTYDYWRKWSYELLPALTARGIHIDEIAAHSFGCIVAAMMKVEDRRVTMLMPVPRPTVTYLTYGRVIHALRHVLSLWYGWYSLALWRGIVLAHNKNRTSLDVIKWISKSTYYSPRQFVYQSKIVRDMDGFYLFAGLNDKAIRSLRIVMASHDTFSTEDYFDMRRDIPHADTMMVSGGHLLPIESPYLLASELYNV